MQVLVTTHYQFYFLVRLYYFSFFQKDKNHSANNYIKGHFFFEGQGHPHNDVFYGNQICNTNFTIHFLF